MTPSPWPDVPALLADWVADVVDLGARVVSGVDLAVPLPEELVRLHHRFEQIHPFIDGNGRAGRLALNLGLVRLGYPPVVVFKKQRSGVPVGVAAVRPRRPRAARRDHRPGDARQPQSLHCPERRRAGAFAAARGARRRTIQRSRTSPGRATGPPRPSARFRRHLAQLAQFGGSLRGHEAHATTKSGVTPGCHRSRARRGSERSPPSSLRDDAG